MKPVTFKSQNGYVIIFAVFLILLLATLWLTSKQDQAITHFKHETVDKDFSEISNIKQRLLQFALLSDQYNPVNTIDATVPISPGYFPCPEDFGAAPDGVADSVGCLPAGTGQVKTGFLPSSDTNSNFYFGKTGRYYLYVDVNYMLPFTGEPDGIRWPLTPVENADSVLVSRYATEMTINGSGDYIAIIVDPGEDRVLEEVSIFNEAAVEIDFDDEADSYNFIYQQNVNINKATDPNVDKLIGISYQRDVLPLLARRICTEFYRYRATNDATSFPHLFVNYTDDPALSADENDEAEAAAIATRQDLIINNAGDDFWFFAGKDARIDGIRPDSWYQWADNLCPEN